MKKNDNTSLADALRKLSSAIAEIADALDSTAKKSEAVETSAEKAAKAASKSTKEESDASTKDIRFEDVRTVLAAKAGKGYRAEAKEILSKRNIPCLSDLESHPEYFAEILKEAEAIGNE